MSKLNLVLIGFFFFIILPWLFFSPKTVFSAASCNATFDPSPNQDMGTLKITVPSTSGLPSGEYIHTLYKPQSREDSHNSERVQYNGETTIEYRRAGNYGWPPGKYEFYFAQTNHGSVIDAVNDGFGCKSEFIIQEEPTQVACTLDIENTSIDPGTSVILVVQNLSSGDYDIFINGIKSQTFSTNNGEKVSLGTFKTSNYYEVTVKNNCGFGDLGCLEKPQQIVCPPIAFAVGERGKDGGGKVAVRQRRVYEDCVPGTPGCTSSAGDPCPATKEEENKLIEDWTGISTALGCIPTKPTELISGLLKFATGIGGGIAFLLMLYGAFEMMTSAGNPERIKSGHERMTAAVIGLLFIIFSVLLLKVIGVDILQIPGFGT